MLTAFRLVLISLLIQPLSCTCTYATEKKCLSDCIPRHKWVNTRRLCEKGARRSLESQEIMLLQNAETGKEKANIVSRKMVCSERKSLVVENFGIA
ncbi:uncharacterized protein B0J16DRAFT_77166 [Fusarium flagelliforme]|uniref:uncharacterized protein n=1 Tax=Fusarium flagelliforme TaxID=2675880 RepID=UPI001E8D92AB|nr:uncharacterized protein B0J16DRAFT_77166 [Fusarium flagelliforme]KAH7193409.1 hypothetical protein B0J16DRAFT_77166 [Fusarium flagelliforme]